MIFGIRQNTPPLPINQPTEENIWRELKSNSRCHQAFIENALKGNQQHEQDILKDLLEKAYDHSIPNLIQTILLDTPIKPSSDLLSIIFLKGTKEDLQTIFKRYFLEFQEGNYQNELIQFLEMISHIRDLENIVKTLIESGVDIRQIVLDQEKCRLIHTAKNVLTAQFWLKFLTDEDKKASSLQKFSLSWELLDKL